MRTLNVALSAQIPVLSCTSWSSASSRTRARVVWSSSSMPVIASALATMPLGLIPISRPPPCAIRREAEASTPMTVLSTKVQRVRSSTTSGVPRTSASARRTSWLVPMSWSPTRATTDTLSPEMTWTRTSGKVGATGQAALQRLENLLRGKQRGSSADPGEDMLDDPRTVTELRLAPQPASARLARVAVLEVLAQEGYEDRAFDAALAVSEVVTNAVLHGREP